MTLLVLMDRGRWLVVALAAFNVDKRALEEGTAGTANDIAGWSSSIGERSVSACEP
jgi:hypothetical protein